MKNDKNPRKDEKSTDGAAPKSRRVRVAVGAVCALLLVAAGAGVIRHFTTPAVTTDVAETADTGIVDWSLVLAAHPDYERYQALASECAVLELEAQDIDELFTVTKPTLDSKPFDDAVWQKNAADVIGARAELERRSKKVAAEYREATKADYEARRAAIDGEYLNAILNLNIKLDNQASMHNPLDSKESIAAEREAWLAEREALQRERGAKQMELARAYNAEITAHVNAVMGPELKKWQDSLPQAHAEQAAAMAARQSEADKRNADAMEGQLEIATRVQQRLEKRQQLADKKSELAALEAHILNDISGKAAKVAILHHLTLIVVHHPRVLSAFDVGASADPLSRSSSIAIGVKTIDVTAELVSELATLEANK